MDVNFEHSEALEFKIKLGILVETKEKIVALLNSFDEGKMIEANNFLRDAQEYIGGLKTAGIEDLINKGNDLISSLN